MKKDFKVIKKGCIAIITSSNNETMYAVVDNRLY